MSIKQMAKDLVYGPDDKLSMTKLAAATAHALMAVMFVKITLAAGFIWELWTTYGGFAIFHAIADKTGKQMLEFKQAQLEATTPPKDAP